MWIQSFFLFSLVWSLGSILKINLRKEFDRQLRAKIFSNTNDISTIAQLKNKIVKKQNAAAAGGGKSGKVGAPKTTKFQCLSQRETLWSPISHPILYALFLRLTHSLKSTLT